MIAAPSARRFQSPAYRAGGGLKGGPSPASLRAACKRRRAAIPASPPSRYGWSARRRFRPFRGAQGGRVRPVRVSGDITDPRHPYRDVMDLRAALAGVIGYSHGASKLQDAQQHLWNVPRDVPPEVPVGLKVRVSGSGQSLPVVPWIAFLDPDVTTTATDGLYLVYLFSSSLDRVYLSMNQGATQHRRRAEASGLKGRAAETAALAEIGAETRAMREALDASMLLDSDETIQLGASNFLPSAYEAGSVAAMTYRTDVLPTAAALGSDLERFAALYARCVELKDALAANRRVETSARSDKKRSTPPPQPVFKPKSSSDYQSKVKAATQTRTRMHEALIETFGNEVIATGRVAATNVHPRDLTVDDDSDHWLVEAKTVGANAEIAVREAIGQLYSYRHFYYREAGAAEPRLLALFSAPIGRAFEELLASLGIEVVYRTGAEWAGTDDGLRLLTQPSGTSRTPSV